MKVQHCTVMAVLLSLSLLAGCATTNSASINPEAGAPSRLIVHFGNMQNSDGQLLVFVHDNSSTYYSDDDTSRKDFNAFRFVKVKPVAPVTTVILEDVPAGRYAVGAVHDEDNDGSLDRMWFPFAGMPSESYGISNDVHSPFSKASFEKALIEVKEPVTEISIKMSTHLRKLVGH
ncbi:MAG: DUF2141 domain-containing protein [Pseudomonadota bacterium]